MEDPFTSPIRRFSVANDDTSDHNNNNNNDADSVHSPRSPRTPSNNSSTTDAAAVNIRSPIVVVPQRSTTMITDGSARTVSSLPSPQKLQQQQPQQRRKGSQVSFNCPMSPKRTTSRSQLEGRETFLQCVLAQQRRMEKAAARRERRRLRKQKESGETPTPTTPALSRQSSVSAPRSPALDGRQRVPAVSRHFSLAAQSLVPAADELHYLEQSGRHTVTGAKEREEQPLCVMLIHRRVRPRDGRPANTTTTTTTRNTPGEEVGEEEEDAWGADEALDDAISREEVVIRYLPMSDILPLLAEGVEGGDVRAHEGRPGLTTMHLEVPPDFSFLPERMKRGAGGGEAPSRPPTSRSSSLLGRNSRQPPHSGRSQSIGPLSPFQAEESGESGQEAPVHDFFVPPPMRLVSILADKHDGVVNYLRHKIMYRRKQLEEMNREDRRNYLVCERRFLFMRQIYRDMARRLENDQRVRRYRVTQRQRRRALDELRQRNERRLSLIDGSEEPSNNSNNNTTDDSSIAAVDSVPASAVARRSTSRRRSSAAGTAWVEYPSSAHNLYTVGREIPEELVQTFFSLNEEYEMFQRSLARQRQRRRRELIERYQRRLRRESLQQQQNGGRGGEGDAEAGTPSREPSRNRSEVLSSATDPDDGLAPAMRWGDALLFPGQRAVDGVIVVTAGPRGMGGWRRVLTGPRSRAERAAASSSRRRGAAAAPRHIDLYAMAQRSSTGAATGSATAAAAGTTSSPMRSSTRRNISYNYSSSSGYNMGGDGESEDDDDDDDDDDGRPRIDRSYLTHFRYQLFYANDSDVSSDDEYLCGEEEEDEDDDKDDGEATRMKELLSGPYEYGTAHYLPRPAVPRRSSSLSPAAPSAAVAAVATSGDTPAKGKKSPVARSPLLRPGSATPSGRKGSRSPLPAKGKKTPRKAAKPVSAVATRLPLSS